MRSAVGLKYLMYSRLICVVNMSAMHVSFHCLERSLILSIFTFV